MQGTNTCPTPVPTDTAWPTRTPTPTATPTDTPVPPSNTPTQTPTQTPVPPSPTTTPQGPALVAPSTTPVVPPSATPAIAPSTTPIVTYKTITHTVTRYHTLLRYKVVYRTVVRYKTVRRKVVSVVYAVRVVQHPKTGRFAAPPSQEHRTVMPRPDAYMSVPRLGISSAPVWTRGYVADGEGGLTYDIVPFYGVTRFAYSVPFGLPGTTLAYGHDDIDGSIFRYLARLKVGDAIGVAVGRRRLTYIVRSVSIVSPTDVRLLTQPRLRPTLALISCTPWWVDTQRVVVIAQIETRQRRAQGT
jgi:LPXTG-site transpeptidase (sortase) family protein